METDDLVNCVYRAALLAASVSTVKLQQKSIDSAASGLALQRLRCSLFISFEILQELSSHSLKIRFVQSSFTAGEAIFRCAAGREEYLEGSLSVLALAAAAVEELIGTATALSHRMARVAGRAAIGEDERVLVSNLPALRINACHIGTLRARALLAQGQVERAKQALGQVEEAVPGQGEGGEGDEGGLRVALLVLRLQIAVEVSALLYICHFR